MTIDVFELISRSRARAENTCQIEGRSSRRRGVTEPLRGARAVLLARTVRSAGFARCRGVQAVLTPSFCEGHPVLISITDRALALFGFGEVANEGARLGSPAPDAGRDRARSTAIEPSGRALFRWTGAAQEPQRSATVRLAPRPAIVRHVAVARPDLEAERELCESAGAGDRSALGKILRRYGPILYRSVLLPRLGSDAAAQDALAETYARVVERFGQFRWQACGVYPWLRVIALRIALDTIRARRRELLYEPDDLEREIDASEQDLTSRGEAELCEKRDLADARARVEAALAKVNPVSYTHLTLPTNREV